jgi:copper chaperone CopZ
MTCANCAKKVETTLRKVANDFVVTLDPPRAVTNQLLSIDEINTSLSTIGKYRASIEPVPTTESNWLSTYYPLGLTLGLIAIAATAGTGWMLNFMAGFFIVFGAFKLLDVQAFADAYARYDIVASKFKPWGLVFPFVETALGFAFLFRFQIPTALWISLAISVIGAIGVIKANLDKRTIQCACLGTVFQLPMSVVTIIENVGMAIMALAMIAM